MFVRFQIYQVCHKLIHHGPVMVWGWCNPQLLLSSWHGWVVDGLDVVAVLHDQFVRNLGADGRVSYLLNN
jgi:hypothetical protein